MKSWLMWRVWTFVRQSFSRRGAFSNGSRSPAFASNSLDSVSLVCPWTPCFVVGSSPPALCCNVSFSKSCGQSSVPSTGVQMDLKLKVCLSWLVQVIVIGWEVSEVRGSNLRKVCTKPSCCFHTAHLSQQIRHHGDQEFDTHLQPAHTREMVRAFWW